MCQKLLEEKWFCVACRVSEAKKITKSWGLKGVHAKAVLLHPSYFFLMIVELGRRRDPNSELKTSSKRIRKVRQSLEYKLSKKIKIKHKSKQ